MASLEVRMHISVALERHDQALLVQIWKNSIADTRLGNFFWMSQHEYLAKVQGFRQFCLRSSNTL